jgi:peroxiredoxin
MSTFPFAIMHARLKGIVLLSGLLMVHACVAMEVQVGRPAPAFQAELLDGSRFDSAEQGGRVLVLNFWATWCRPCQEEMPALDAYYRAHRAAGLEVIAISIDEPGGAARVRQTMKNFSFHAALANAARTEGFGKLMRVPITFVIDREGVLRFDGRKFTGKLDQQTLDAVVTPLLRNPGKTIFAASHLPGKH